jgi:hypothetical protein
VRQWAGPIDAFDHDKRWAIARSLLHDDDLNTEDRIAGLLVVLYAQVTTRVSNLRREQFVPNGNGIQVALGTAVLDLPQPMVTLFVKLDEERANTERSRSVWMFPGRPWTRPISPGRLRDRLTTINVPAGTARKAALLQLAVELPAAIVARCLGIDISSATAWQRAAAGDWHQYAARVADRPSSARTSAAGRHTALAIQGHRRQAVVPHTHRCLMREASLGSES